MISPNIVGEAVPVVTAAAAEPFRRCTQARQVQEQLGARAHYAEVLTAIKCMPSNRAADNDGAHDRRDITAGTRGMGARDSTSHGRQLQNWQTRR